MTGRMISHYRILEKIGEGGMGVVYKAEDTKLERTVALKFLAPHVLESPEYKARFVHEAKAAAAIDHPNICTVYEIDEAEGQTFIAMAYVDGSSLRQKIEERPLKLDEALEIAIQAGQGLHAAHKKGITHRDIKSANIMLTEEGRVKIMDFGLAHLGGLTRLTKSGTTLGTPAYMSPEQVRGEDADRRTDIWSLGVVLYEIVSGQLPFKGEVVAAVSYSILNEAPEPLTALRAGLPIELDRVVAKALAKSGDERYQHVDELLVDLKALKRTLESGPGAASAPIPTLAWRPGRWFAAAAVVVLVLAGAWWFLGREGGEKLPPPRVVPLTAYPGMESEPSFSPDGNQVAFARNTEGENNWDIYVTRVDSATPLRLTTDPARDSFPAWSPDGRWIAVLRQAANQKAIYLVSPLGESERKLVDLPGAMGSLAWSPDGRWLAVGERVTDGTSGIILIPTEEGEKRQLTSKGPPVYDHSPSFSPEGHYLAYASHTGMYLDELYLQGLNKDYSSKGEARRLAHQAGSIAGVQWVPDGQSLIYSLSLEATVLYHLWRTSISGGSEPERWELAGANAERPAVSPIGNRLAFARTSGGGRDIWKYEVGGDATEFIATSLRDGNPQFSPDGKRIAFGSNRAGGRSAIWICNADGSNPVQLTRASERDRGTPSWSPDGRWIAYDGQDENGRYDIYVIDAAGGQPRQLTHDPADDNMPSWSRDGQSVYFHSNHSGRNEVMRIPVAGGEAVQVTDNGGEFAQESWDGKTLYYQKSWSDQWPLFARPVDGGPERQVLDSSLGYCVVKNGVYYRTRVGDDGAVSLLFHEFSSGRGRMLTRIQGDTALRVAVSPDEKTVLVTVIPPKNIDLMLVENFR